MFTVARLALTGQLACVETGAVTRDRVESQHRK